MRKIIVDIDIPDEVVLWRYMSLEKFIYLINEHKIFLSPISFFRDSDPLEGHLPKKFNEMFKLKMQEMDKFFDDYIKIDSIDSEDIRNLIGDSRKTSRRRLSLMREKVRGRQSICCWYESAFESEAMWKLYGDNGKAVAIKTTVGSLKKSIISEENKNLVYLKRVKYIDFNDMHINLEEILGDDKKIANIILKRKEYDHEREVRLYHTPNELDMLGQANYLNDYWEKYEIKPYLLNVNVNELIESVIISPYVREPYISSVKAICKAYQLMCCEIYQSSILEKYDL